MSAASMTADLDRRTRAHRSAAIRTVVVVGAVLAVVLAIPGALLLPPVVGVLMAVVVAGAVVAGLALSAESRVLAAVGCRSVTEEEQPRLHNLVDSLAVTVGVPGPSVAVLDETAIDVGVLGVRAPGTLVVTTGALSGLDRLQLEGALARALLELRVEAQLPRTLATGMLGRLGGGLADRLAGVDDLDAEVLVDEAAGMTTRHPPSLAQALEAAAAAPHRPTGVSATGVVWLAADPEWLPVRSAALHER